MSVDIARRGGHSAVKIKCRLSVPRYVETEQVG